MHLIRALLHGKIGPNMEVAGRLGSTTTLKVWSLVCSLLGNCSRAYPGGSDGGGRSPLGKFDAPQNNDFHLKIRAVLCLVRSVI